MVVLMALGIAAASCGLSSKDKARDDASGEDLTLDLLSGDDGFDQEVGADLLGLSDLSDAVNDGPPGTLDGVEDLNGGDGADADNGELVQPGTDLDMDGVLDEVDNCPDGYNPDQKDTDLNGVGDACQAQNGTIAAPFLIQTQPLPTTYHDLRTTCGAASDALDSYPPASQDESGPEIVYAFHVDVSVDFSASIAYPEPAGTDIDLHLLTSIQPMNLVERAHYSLAARLIPGTYFLVMDTYVDAGGERCGFYDLNVTIAPLPAVTVDGILALGGEPGTPLQLPYWYQETNDTGLSGLSDFDNYPPDTLNMSGPEVIYQFTLDRPARVAAVLETPEPWGVDVDVHLLSSLSPPVLVDRGDRSAYAVLPQGTWYLVMDTYVENQQVLSGPYRFSLSVREVAPEIGDWFNAYILAAVDYIYANYGLLGYDSAVLTHDLTYGSYGTIPATGGARTMCVAAAMEIMLQAMILWAEDTGDASVFDFLPLESFTSLQSTAIKAHIWVNHDLDSWGTADALAHFGMGEPLPFEDLSPGSFLNLNRTTGTGHAVVFVAYIDAAGNRFDQWNSQVVGFLYFSSQGGYDVGAGGMDYRYAIFDDFGTPEMPYKRDLGVIYSTNPHYLNTGMMWSPSRWDGQRSPGRPGSFSRFDEEVFDGMTADDSTPGISRFPRPSSH